MKRSRLLAIAVPALFLVFMMTSCGQTYHTDSITISPTSVNLSGLGATQQFTVMAHNSNGKTEDVTNRVTFDVTPGVQKDGSYAPLASLSINGSGLAQATSNGGPVCTWNAMGTASMGPYSIVAKFNGLNSQPAYVNLATESNCGPNSGLTSLSVTPNSVVLNSGSQQALTVTGNYQDGSTLNLTSLATFSVYSAPATDASGHALSISNLTVSGNTIQATSNICTMQQNSSTGQVSSTGPFLVRAVYGTLSAYTVVDVVASSGCPVSVTPSAP